ncbi:MAG TPA: hypothetical protein VKA21_08435 [Candidatus Binatia bacterium]|nr:hypothetical protein [Candidatus Binatia bacterium]
MRRTPEASVPGALHAALAALPVVVDGVACDVGGVRVPSYPGAIRPTSVVRLGEGRGENVAWTAGAQEAFRSRLDRVPRGRWRLDEWSAEVATRFPDRYERAALEAAAIDLALRQRGTDLAGLVGATSRPVRYVVSFEKVADPVSRTADEPKDVELKIDADPTWDDATWEALGALGRVAVLDFKLSGTPADHERAHRALPRAWLEDPAGNRWSPALRRRISFDAALDGAGALDALPCRPAAVNLKPARMGGVLELLACAADCGARGIAVYVGGMFEVGPGRSQLAALAALISPDGPNDIAPLVEAERPSRLAVGGTVGFG